MEITRRSDSPKIMICYDYEEEIRNPKKFTINLSRRPNGLITQNDLDYSIIELSIEKLRLPLLKA